MAHGGENIKIITAQQAKPTPTYRNIRHQNYYDLTQNYNNYKQLPKKHTTKYNWSQYSQSNSKILKWTHTCKHIFFLLVSQTHRWLMPLLHSVSDMAVDVYWMERSSLWEADSSSSSQIAHILWHPKVHYSLYNSTSLTYAILTFSERYGSRCLLNGTEFPLRSWQ